MAQVPNAKKNIEVTDQSDIQASNLIQSVKLH